MIIEDFAVLFNNYFDISDMIYKFGRNIAVSERGVGSSAGG